MPATLLLNRQCCAVGRAGSARPAPVAHISRTSKRALKAICFRENEKPVSRDVEKAVQKNVAKVTRKMTGFLSNPSTHSKAYWALGSTAAATAAAGMLLPGFFAGVIFGATTDPVVDSIARAAGATLIVNATVKYTLKEASMRGQLYMDTFQRLNLGLLLHSGTCLVVLAQAISLRNPLLTAFMGVMCGASLLLSSRIYSLNKGGFPFPSPSKTLSGAISVLMPRNIPAAVYSLMTIAFASMAAMCLGASPGKPLVTYEGLSGPMTVFLHRVTGAGMLLQMLVAYSLKDGADRQKLGATTFRWLNLGLAASLLAKVCFMTIDWQSGVLVHGSQTVGMLAAHIAAFMWTSNMYVAGESKPKLATAMPAPASA